MARCPPFSRRSFAASHGAEFMDDVAPWEDAKLRLLNGGHLAIAYLGLLAGFRTVDEAMAQPLMVEFVRRFLLHEQCPTLQPSGVDTASYVRELESRWRSPGITDSLLRVGRNGSSKLPVRVLLPMRENASSQRPTPCAELLVVAWMRCAGAMDDDGGPVPLEDPLSAAMQAVGRVSGNDPVGLVDAMAALPGVFGADVVADIPLRRRLHAASWMLQRHGALAAIRACLGGAFA